VISHGGNLLLLLLLLQVTPLLVASCLSWLLASR
jgi:hypothetical protein